MTNSNYSCKFTWDPRDGLFIVTSFEFPGLSAVGETREEALENFEEVLDDYKEEYLSDGVDLPEPLEIIEFSGQLRLRIPKSLHKRLAELAEHERVSLNTLLVQMLSEGIGAKPSIRVENLTVNVTRQALSDAATLSEPQPYQDDLLNRLHSANTGEDYA